MDFLHLSSLANLSDDRNPKWYGFDARSSDLLLSRRGAQRMDTLKMAIIFLAINIYYFVINSMCAAISAIHLDRNGKRKTLSKTFLCFIMFRDYPKIVNHKVMHLIKNRFFFYRMNLFPCVLFFLIVTYF